MDRAIPNKDIIDATQNAVLNAASNMADVLEATADEISGHHEPFYMGAEFWVAMAFVVAVLMILKPAINACKKMMRNKAKAISKRISDAVNLKEEAQKLLAEYESKYRGAEKEAKEILLRSEKEIDLIKKEALAKLEADMLIKEKEAKSRLKNAEEDALKEISDKTADVTLAVVKKILNDSLDEKALSLLIDASIENLKKQV